MSDAKPPPAKKVRRFQGPRAFFMTSYQTGDEAELLWQSYGIVGASHLGVSRQCYLAPIRPFAPCRMRAVIVSFAVWGFSLQAAPVPETAVFSAFRQVDAGLSHFVQLQRTGVTGELDLVIAMGSAKAFPAETPWIFWTEDRKTAFSCRRKTAPSAPICWEQNSDSRTAPRVSNVSLHTIPSSPVMARNPSSSPIRSGSTTYGP